LLEGFEKAGCIKILQAVDKSNFLFEKFKQQLKKKNISVEKAYKGFEPQV